MKPPLSLTVLAGLALVLVPTAAQSVADATPPTLRTPIKSSFIVGGQVSDANYPACGSSTNPADIYVGVPETFKWTGSDDSGYVRYDLEELNYSNGGGPVLENSTQTSYSSSAAGQNGSGQCSGNSNPTVYWEVTARDAAGNSVTRTVRGSPLTLTQDNNLTDDQGYAVRPTISYSAGWSTSSCLCWSQDGTHQSKVARASATIAMTVPPDEVSHLGLIMAKAPDRGSFKLYVDGALKATISTYAATKQSRIIVWQASLAAGNHQVKIVNVATPGHPRIDLDAVVTN